MRIYSFAVGVAAYFLATNLAFAAPVNHDIPPFRAIEVQDGVQLHVTIAPEQSVLAEAVRGDVSQLRIREFLPWAVFDRRTRWFIFPNWRDDLLTVSIEMSELNGLKAFDSAQATFVGDAQDRLWVEAGDDGHVILEDINVADLTLAGRNDGLIVAGGTCERLTIRGGGAQIDASGMQCDSIVVREGDLDLTLAPGANIVDAHPDADS